MERYFAFADQTTGRCPFDERAPATSSWTLFDRTWSFARGTLVAPLLIALRVPLVLHTVLLWYLVSFLPKLRTLDRLFSRILLFIFGFYRIPAYKSSRTRRMQQPFASTDAPSLVFGRVCTPTDLLVYIFCFSPVAVHVPWYTPSGDLVHRLEKPVKAFILFCVYDQRFKKAESLVDAKSVDIRAQATCESSTKMLSKASGFGPKATLLFFPECSLTNGRVVLKTMIEDVIDSLTQTKKPIFCASVDNDWKYRSVIHPFPDLALLIRDLGEPRRRSTLYAAVLPQDKVLTHENIIEGISLASGSPCGGMTASNRYLYLQKARGQKEKP